MNRATTSLPVPDSPVSSTVVSVTATCVAWRSTSCQRFGLARDADAVPATEASSSRQRSHAQLEARGALARFGGPRRGFGEALMRERQRDMVGDAPGDQGVAGYEAPRR